VPLVRGGLGRVRLGVEQHLADVDGREAVDEGRVRLGDHRHPVADQPVDQVELPQRSVAVQRLRGHAGHERAQLLHGARPG
jgi:hypothetical protein